MKLKLIVAFAALSLAAPALSQVASTGQYGDVTTNASGYVLTSNPSSGAGYGGLYFEFNPGFTLNQLTQLSADYTQTIGTFGGGSPRFTLFDSTSNANNTAYIYFGTPTGGTFADPMTGTTGNFANLLSGDIRVECNGFMGCLTSYPGTTFGDFVAQAGLTAISYITLDVDGGFAGTQQLAVTDFNVNGNHLPEVVTGSVPEPATWAMMLLGFGAMGGALRRNRRKNLIAQMA